METDGIVGEYGTDVVWSLERVVERNLLFWAPDIFVWDHATDSRLWAARELEVYLHRSLAGDGDWW
ncbi:hypothetical protein ABZS68_12565 [Streptomyces sp. NPDC005571]|uniref:hypothetical protein n=1 Tax=unclassified Streptomyces TaxID=2593676 RepID=UPI0033A3C1F0